MQQPELGRRLIALRKQQNLTQEELVEKSHVSVRTIQRIESGEVMPRLSTVKILFEALGVEYETISSQSNQVMETKKNTLPGRMSLLAAALSGAVYLICQIVLATLDVAWLTKQEDWGFTINAIYTGLTILMVFSYGLFAWGFITLSTIFENTLLKGATYMLMIATAALAVLDITSLTTEDVDTLLIPYVLAALLFGTLSIIFGIGLIRLQDGMGELSRIAGFLEIAMGCFLITVILFFIAHVIMIAAIVVEILVLWRGYEYVSRQTTVQTS